jgi:hypothetical protein
MSAIGDRINALSASWLTITTITASDGQAANDAAHICRGLNDEVARLLVAGTLAKSGGGVSGGIPISSGSTIVQILPSGLKPSTLNWLAGAP